MNVQIKIPPLTSKYSYLLSVFNLDYFKTSIFHNKLSVIQSSNNLKNLGIIYRDLDNTISEIEQLNFNFRDSSRLENPSKPLYFFSDYNNPVLITKVYLFSSVIELLSYHCIYPQTDAASTLLISLPFIFDFEHISQLKKEFVNAKFISCFNNSLNGHINDIRAAIFYQGHKYQITRDNNKIQIKNRSNNSSVSIDEKDLTLFKVNQLFNQKYYYLKTHKPPKNNLNFNQLLDHDKITYN